MTREQTMNRSARLTTTGALVVLLLGPATATAAVTECGTVCDADCQLTQTLKCEENEDGITLTNGADLDLNGFSIDCVAHEEIFQGLCGVAVRMTGTNSVITGAPSSYITGPWNGVIDCAGFPGSRAEGVRIEAYWPGPTGAAIYGCQFVEDNVVQGLVQSMSGGVLGTTQKFPGRGIAHVPIDDNDLIAGNYVGGCQTAIGTAPSESMVTIDRNTITLPKLFPGVNPGSSGIDLLHPDPTFNPSSISNNVIIGNGSETGGAPIRIHPAATSATFSNNVCRGDLHGCDGCVALGMCVAVGTVASN